MALDSVLTPPGGMAGRRFFLVSYLPTASAGLYVLVLVWAGARGWRQPRHHKLDFHAAWNTGAHLGAAELAALGVAIAVLAFVLAPLQSILLRALESERPRLLQRGQAKRKQKLEEAASFAAAAETPAAPAATAAVPTPTANPPEPDTAKVQTAGRAGYDLRHRFSLAATAQTVKATAFGNALAAAADQAGRPYGIDTAVAWPRLYPVLSDQMRAVVDDRRDTMDATARMTAVMATTTVVGLVLLLRTGLWCFLALIPLTLAALAYVSAVQAALAYGESVRVAFELFRFDLLTPLHLKAPADPDAEKATFAALSNFWRQGIPLPAGTLYVEEPKT